MFINEHITPANQCLSPKEDFFSKEMSVMMAGFAILLMMIHHLFKSSVWLDDGVVWHTSFGYIGEVTIKILSITGEICVQIFALTSGYALMMNPKAYAT